MTVNCKQAVEDFIKPFGFDTSSDGLFVHDVLHVALGQTQLDPKMDRPSLTDEAELVTMLFQAVLLRDITPHPNINELKDGGRTPLFGEIIALLPKGMSHEFMGREGYKDLEPNDMREHYYTAREMGRLIEEKFDKHLGDFSRQELEDTDLSVFQEILEQAKGKSIGRMGGGLER